MKRNIFVFSLVVALLFAVGVFTATTGQDLSSWPGMCCVTRR